MSEEETKRISNHREKHHIHHLHIPYITKGKAPQLFKGASDEVHAFDGSGHEGC